MRSTPRVEMLDCLGHHQLACSIQVEAGVSIDMAHFGQANHEWRVSHDAVEALILNGFVPGAVA